MGARNFITALLALALVTVPAVGTVADHLPAADHATDDSLQATVQAAVHDAAGGEVGLDTIATRAYAEEDGTDELAQRNLDTSRAEPILDPEPRSLPSLMTDLGMEDPIRNAAEIAKAPDELQDSLAGVLAALLDYRETAREAFDHPDRRADAEAVAQAVDRPTGDPVEAQLPDVDSLLDAREHLASTVQGLALATEEHGPVDVTIEECPSLSIDLTDTNDTYPQDCALVIDAGGDDTYENNAGGTRLGETSCGIIDYETHRFAAALVDLGGDDVYGDEAQPRDCGVNGGGWGGAGFLWDENGEDRYAAGSTATNGGALYGLGFLHDGGGEDLYTAGGYAVNGGGAGGIGLLHDEAGDDTYRGTAVAVNGGSYTGVGLLVDEAGNDTYEAGSKGANGGNIRGVGTLIDRAGDDTYRAADTGVNGGSEVEILGFLSVIIPPSSGLGLLLDAAGEDTYRDLEGGTGPDETVLAKGYVGAQVDLPHLPSDTQGHERDRQAPSPRPHVTVGISDDEINPYHEQFYRPELTEHPCTYIPDFPCDIPALNLTLDADSREEALEADENVWDSVEPGEWYWIPQTSFIAVSCEPGSSGPCIVNDEPFPDRHGTETVSSVLSENEDALVAFANSDASLDLFLNRGIPVDLFASSYAHDLGPRPLPAGTCGVSAEHELVGLYVKSTHDLAAYPTTADCWDGAPNVVEVNGGLPDGSVAMQSNPQPELSSYYCRPTAAADSINGTTEPVCGGGTGLGFGYTSSHPGGPTAAGAISKVIQAVREETGYSGNVEDGIVDPLYGEDGLSVGELRDAVNRTASYEPPAQYDVDTNSAFVQDTPREGRWAFWGWGFYDGWTANATVDHLLESQKPVKPLAVQLYMEGQETFTSTYYGDRR